MPGRSRFDVVMALALASMAFVGFAPMYFLKSVLHPSAVLTPLMHVHGLLFAAWTLLLVAQTMLVAARKADLHRRLGITPAIARLWFVQQRPPIALGLTNLFVLAVIAHDWWRDRRVHPVSPWGGLGAT